MGQSSGKIFRGRKNLCYFLLIKYGEGRFTLSGLRFCFCCHDRDAPSRTRLYIASGDDYRNHRLEWTVPIDGPSVGIDWFAIKVTIV